MKSTLLSLCAAVSALLLSGCCSQKCLLASRWLKTGEPVQLTFGEGNDMEAACAPDGRSIAYENDAEGGLRVFVLDCASGERTLVCGGGKGVMAAYPSWTPDGGLVYALSAPIGTAAVQVPAGGDIGCNLWLWKDGERTRLTKGLWRDFTPSVSPDGASVWFTTSRGRQNLGDGSHLAVLALDKAGFPVTEKIESAGISGSAAVSPVLSPRGRLLAWAKADGAFANWCIMLGDAADPARCCALTDAAKMNCYAPRWSPDGEFIACTGYRVGDPGWSVYVIHVRSGQVARVETGDAGNSKSPCWTADGKALVYENNATGSYKLYRLPVSMDCGAIAMTDAVKGAAGKGVRTGKWMPPSNEAGESRWLCADGTYVPGKSCGEHRWFFEKPTASDFGNETFYAKVRFRLDRTPEKASVAAAGHYAGGRPGAPAWQFFVDNTRHLRFASCNILNDYVDVVWGKQLELGKEYTAIGIHACDGRLKLWVEGDVPQTTTVEGGQPLDECLGIAVGIGWEDGRHPFLGEVFEAECGLGEPAEMPRAMSVQALLELERK